MHAFMIASHELHMFTAGARVNTWRAPRTGGTALHEVVRNGGPVDCIACLTGLGVPVDAVTGAGEAAGNRTSIRDSVHGPQNAVVLRAPNSTGGYNTSFH